MGDGVQILAVAVSVALLALVLELVRRRLLGSEYALVWIGCGLGLLALSAWPRALDGAAHWLGIQYGPAVLLLLLGVFVFLALLFFSAVVSRQRTQIERLVEDQAILEARLRDLAGDTGDWPPLTVRPSATAERAPAPPQRPPRPVSGARRRRRRTILLLVAAGGAMIVGWLAWRAWTANGGDGAGGGLSLLLVTADTTRQDDLPVYGGAASMPRLERLAGDGVVFTEAYTVATGTTPSHASLMTALHSSSHGVYDNKTRLADGFLTLAEVLASTGRRTAAFVSATPVARAVGLDQGFEVYDDTFGLDETLGEFRHAERRAGDTAGRAEAWLRQNGRRPFFVWVHFYDPHQPYAPLPGGDGAAGARAPRPRARAGPERFFTEPSGLPRYIHVEDVPPAERVAVDRLARDRYRGELAAMDRGVGRLLDTLVQLGLYDRTVVLFVADHGESFLEEGPDLAWGHGGLPSSVVRVPLILKLAGSALSGRHSAQLVGTNDLAPVLLDALGVPRPGSWRGPGVAAVSSTTADPARDHLVIESAHRNLVSVRTRDWSLTEVRRPMPDGDNPPTTLYFLPDDPDGRHNLADQRPEVLARLEPYAEEVLAVDRAAGEAVDSPEHLEALRRLGYLQ